MKEAMKEQYPYLHTYSTLYQLFSNNCTRKCRRKCTCQLRSLIITDALYDEKFKPCAKWL